MEKLYQCPQCKTDFKIKAKFLRHYSEIHGPKKCNQCGIITENKEELKLHIKKTHQVKCTECNQFFQSNSELKKHTNTEHVSDKHTDYCQCYSCKAKVKLPEQNSEKTFFRLLLQSKYVNSQTELQAVHLPTLEEIVEQCALPNTIYGSLDFCQFYWQIPCSQRYGKLFNITTPFGTHQPQRAMQGDQSSPFAAMKTARMLTENVEGSVPMLDDVLIASSTAHQWLDKFQQLLKNMRNMAEEGQTIKLRPDKLTVLTDQVSFLSHTIKNGFLEADEGKLRKLRDWKIPETLKQLQSFIGYASYFRDFIMEASGCLKPLTDLANSAPQKLGLHWKERHTRAFNEIKQLTKELPNLKIIQNGKGAGQLHVYHDSSNEAYGGVLTQELKTPEGKVREYPLHFFSRLHQGAEKCYSIPESELSSLAVMVQKYRHHLIGKRFTIHSDSSVVYWALRNMMLRKPNYSKTIKRLCILLEGLSFQVKHIASEKNPADWPTRLEFKSEKELKISQTKRKMNLPKVIAGVIQPRENEKEVQQSPDFLLDMINPEDCQDEESAAEDTPVYLGNVSRTDTPPATTLQDTSPNSTLQDTSPASPLQDTSPPTLQEVIQEVLKTDSDDKQDTGREWSHFLVENNNYNFELRLPSDLKLESEKVIACVNNITQHMTTPQTFHRYYKHTVEPVEPTVLVNSSEPVTDKVNEYSDTYTVAAVTTRLQTDSSLAGDITPQLVYHQKGDPELRELHKLVRKSPDNEYSKNGESFYITAGVLLAKNIQSGKNRICAPQALQRDIILSAHSPAHLGINKTVDRVKKKWQMKGISEKVKDIIKQCNTCQMFSTTKKGKYPHQVPPDHLTKGHHPGQVIAIDVWSAGNNIQSAFKYIIAATDLFSRHVWTRNLKSATSEEIARFLVEDVFRYRVPRKILSDNANNIAGGVLPELYKSINRGFSALKMKENKVKESENTDFDPETLLQEEEDPEGDQAEERIKQITSTAYHPQGNSQIERWFRTYKEWITKTIKNHPETWHQYTGLMTYLYNTTIHRALRTSPAHVLMGIDPSESYPDVIDMLEHGAKHSENSYLNKLSKEVKEARKMASDIKHQNKYYASVKEQFYRDNKQVRPHQFELGSLVLVKRMTPRDKLSVKAPYMGPAKVIGLLGTHVLLVQYLNNGYIRKRSVSQCKPYYMDEQDTQASGYYTGPERRDPRTDFALGDDGAEELPLNTHQEDEPEINSQEAVIPEESKQEHEKKQRDQTDTLQLPPEPVQEDDSNIQGLDHIDPFLNSQSTEEEIDETADAQEDDDLVEEQEKLVEIPEEEELVDDEEEEVTPKAKGVSFPENFINQSFYNKKEAPNMIYKTLGEAKYSELGNQKKKLDKLIAAKEREIEEHLNQTRKNPIRASRPTFQFQKVN